MARAFGGSAAAAAASCGLGPFGRLDERLYFHRIFDPGSGFDAGGDVDAPGLGPQDGSSHVAGVQASGDEQTLAFGQVAGHAPSRTPARARAGRVEQDGVGPVIVGVRHSRVSPGKGLYDHRDPLADPVRLLGRLPPVQLGGLEAGGVNDLDDPPGGVVAENPHGQEIFAGQALDDVGHPLRGNLTGRRGEDEPDGIGAHGDGQQGVVLRSGAANL